MKVVRSLAELARPPRGTVLTIGNFDGVHLGHREIFRRVVRCARAAHGTAAVLTFEPHPLRLLAPDRAPLRINTPAEKIRLIEASCIDLLLVLPFTTELAALTATDFLEQVLLGSLAVRHLIVGYDYAFGRHRQGDIDFLRRMADRHGFTLDVLQPINSSQGVYSSTQIRQAIAAGAVDEVVRVLGRNFTLDGRVVHGDGRGRALGFPTANLLTDKELLPRDGVYAVKVKWREQLYDGVANLGRRPTFPAAGGEGGPLAQARSLEIHLLDFRGDLYGENLRLYFVERLRDEQRFTRPEDLQAAISNDVAEARACLTAAEIVVYQEYLDCGTETAAESGRL